jgi:ribosome maturation factor RimP
VSLAARFFYFLETMKREDTQKQVEELITPILDDLAYELVDLQMQQEGRTLALVIYIDKPGGVTLDDCVRVSREVGAIMEIEDPIKSAYRLEVSSPGLDRPLKKAADFERFAGKKAKLKSKEMIDPDQRGNKRKTFVGNLLGFEDGKVKLELTDKRGGVILVALDDLERANLEEEF